MGESVAATGGERAAGGKDERVRQLGCLPARGLWGRGPRQEAWRPVGTRGFDALPVLPWQLLDGGNKRRARGGSVEIPGATPRGGEGREGGLETESSPSVVEAVRVGQADVAARRAVLGVS